MTNAVYVARFFFFLRIEQASVRGLFAFVN